MNWRQQHKMTKEFNQRLITRRTREGVQYSLYSGESRIAVAISVRGLMQTCANAKPFRTYARESERQLRENPDLNAIEVKLYNVYEGRNSIK